MHIRSIGRIAFEIAIIVLVFGITGCEKINKMIPEDTSVESFLGVWEIETLNGKTLEESFLESDDEIEQPTDVEFKVIQKIWKFFPDGTWDFTFEFTTSVSIPDPTDIESTGTINSHQIHTANGTYTVNGTTIILMEKDAKATVDVTFEPREFWEAQGENVDDLEQLAKQDLEEMSPDSIVKEDEFEWFVIDDMLTFTNPDLDYQLKRSDTNP
ncbi:hypothetical protein JT359_17460 [Candidatus Poribacteria bacterium]|nr:hypothetical protein [Candidatus Poribacteria bacterium]